MSDPTESDHDEHPEKAPAQTEHDEREEGKTIATGWVRVGVVSIFATLLTVVALMQASGLIDVLPFGQDWTVEWLVLVLVAAVLVAVELWTWRSRRL